MDWKKELQSVLVHSRWWNSEVCTTAGNNGPDERTISSGSLEVGEHTEVLTTANNGLEERAMISSGSLKVVEQEDNSEA